MVEIPERSAPLPLRDVPGELDRVALLSDVHGNLPALEACLRDVEAAGVDAVCLLGDTVWGPQPVRCSTAWPTRPSRSMGCAATANVGCSSSSRAP